MKISAVAIVFFSACLFVWFSSGLGLSCYQCTKKDNPECINEPPHSRFLKNCSRGVKFCKITYDDRHCLPEVEVIKCEEPYCYKCNKHSCNDS